MTEMTVREMASKGGIARAQKLDPARLRGIGSLGYLRRAVTEVCNRVDELSDADRQRLFDALLDLDGAV